MSEQPILPARHAGGREWSESAMSACAKSELGA